MKRQTRLRVQGVCAFVLLALTQGCSQLQGRQGMREPLTFHPVLRIRTLTEMDEQRSCADQLVNQLVRRDGLDGYVKYQEVQLEPSYRIRVFFQFNQDMRAVFPRLHRFWRFPSWIGGGRYASNYGRGPGFEIHLNREDPTRTVPLNAPKSSDVDEHEPAGNLRSIVLHAWNVVQHKLGRREKSPCRMLAELPQPQREVAEAGMK